MDEAEPKPVIVVPPYPATVAGGGRDLSLRETRGAVDDSAGNQRTHEPNKGRSDPALSIRRRDRERPRRSLGLYLAP